MGAADGEAPQVLPKQLPVPMTLYSSSNMAQM